MLFFQDTEKRSACQRLGDNMIFTRLSLFFTLILAIGAIEEKARNLKTFQLMLVNPVIYWLSHFMFDFPIAFIYNVSSFISFAAKEGQVPLKDFLLEHIGKSSL